MAILEVGINIGPKNLVEIKYYSASDNIINPDIRARFLSGIESYITEVYGDSINVISLSNFQIICYYKTIQMPGDDEDNTQPLLSYAITDKNVKPNLVKRHLKEIISDFMTQYTPKDIFLRESKYFVNFQPHINDILGDLKLTTEDRIGLVVRKKKKEEKVESKEEE